MQTYHYETSVVVPTSAERLFAYVDDPASLAAHMQKSSWRMGGGRMQIEMDAGHGQRVGSRIRMTGRVLGTPLWLEEQVIQREAPFRKQWQTTAPPRLWVIGPYRMGLEIGAAPHGSLLRVFIDYELPAALAGWLGRLFGPYYARWCTRRMTNDAVKYFSTAQPLSH